MTKYEVISSDIRKKIQNGTFPLNSQLPTEPELGEQYNVSRITVKKAIDQLVSEGLVIKKRGSGTFVKGLAELPGTGELPPQAGGLFQTLTSPESNPTWSCLRSYQPRMRWPES